MFGCILVFVSGCQNDAVEPSNSLAKAGPLFELINPSKSGVQFSNDIQDLEKVNNRYIRLFLQWRRSSHWGRE